MDRRSLQLADGVLQAAKLVPPVDQVDVLGHRFQHQGDVDGRVTAAQHRHALASKVILMVNKVVQPIPLQLVGTIEGEFAGSEGPIPQGNNHRLGMGGPVGRLNGEGAVFLPNHVVDGLAEKLVNWGDGQLVL